MTAPQQRSVALVSALLLACSLVSSDAGSVANIDRIRQPEGGTGTGPGAGRGGQRWLDKQDGTNDNDGPIATPRTEQRRQRQVDEGEDTEGEELWLRGLKKHTPSPTSEPTYEPTYEPTADATEEEVVEEVVGEEEEVQEVGEEEEVQEVQEEEEPIATEENVSTTQEQRVSAKDKKNKKHKNKTTASPTPAPTEEGTEDDDRAEGDDKTDDDKNDDDKNDDDDSEGDDNTGDDNTDWNTDDDDDQSGGAETVPPKAAVRTTPSPTPSPTPAPTSGSTAETTKKYESLPEPKGNDDITEDDDDGAPPVPEEKQAAVEEEQEEASSAPHDHGNGVEDGSEVDITGGGMTDDEPTEPTAEFPPGDKNIAEEAIEEEITVVAEEKAAKKVGGWAVVFALLAMVLTAWQVSDNPDGVYASVCRLSITVCGCVVKILLLPFKYVCGNFFTGSSGPGGGGHHPIAGAPDYREPYRGRHGMVEMA